MAWEQRGSRSYYYRARRVNGRVVKQYLGAGPIAVAAATIDLNQRAEREGARRLGDHGDLGADAALDELEAIVFRALIAAGFHRPKRGRWRRRREKAKDEGAGEAR